jgi:addiction module HigA family antidote
MTMKNPPHPGPGLRDDLKALGLPVSAAAVGLGVTRQQLYNVLKGRSGVSPDMALRLEKGVGGTAESWLALQMAYDLAQARMRKAGEGVTRLAPKVA